MEAHGTLPYLREILVFLTAAAVAVPLLRRLRVSPVLGFLILGGFIGPFGLGLFAADFPPLRYIVISEREGVSALAELGVVFLLFMIGLELSLDRLWAMRRLVFGLGSLQILVTGAAIGLAAWRFGNSPAASIVLGACLALSSTAIVMQLLIEERRLGTPVGRAGFSILLMQDLAVVPILFTVGVLGRQASSNVGMEFLLSLATAAATIALLYGFGRLVLRPVFRLVSQARMPELFMAAILLTVLGTAAITDVAGLSMALGAFLAGLLLAETEFRHQVEVVIEPFKGLMLGLFFMSVGMGIDWRLVGADPFWIAASVVGLILLKWAITAGLCLAFRLPRHTAVETGLLLGQGGEFAFIVVGLAMSVGLVPAGVGQFMLIVTGITMVLTPFLAGAARHLGTRLERKGEGTDEDEELQLPGEPEAHVILAGFGRVGRTLASTLDAEGIGYVAVDTDPEIVALARQERKPVYYGDASRIEVLERADIGNAWAVAVTMDDPAANQRIVGQVHRHWQALPVFARARDALHARRLIAAGATAAVPETTEASLQLAGRVLEGLGVDQEAVRRQIEYQRTLEEP